MKNDEKYAQVRAQISKNIRGLRLKSGMTKKEVALKAKISYRTYLNIENNKSQNPSISKLVQIARALGVHSCEIFDKV